MRARPYVAQAAAMFFICYVLMSQTVKAQTYYINENFNSLSAGNTLPSGWTNNILSGNSSYDFFRFGQSGVFDAVGNPGTRTSGNSNTSGIVVIFDSDNQSQNGGLENVALESPSFNTTGGVDIHLRWDQDYHGGYQSGDSINVEVFNGTSWIKVYEYGAYSTSGAAAIQNSPDIDVTSLIANKTGVKVRFRYRGNWSWWWLFDNVQVYAEPTPIPGFTINNASQCLPGNSFTFTNTSTIADASSMTYSWDFGDATNSSATSPSGKTYGSANSYTVTLTATSNLGVSASTSKTVTVDAVATPLVSIAASPSNSVCASTSVTFTATPTNGGTVPTYQWKKNGNNVATGATWNAGTSLATGDDITCEMTSSYPCPTGGISTVTSNTVNMTVTPELTPSVSVTANPGNSFCPGTNATFTATPTNGGTTPAYQWKKNGSNVGTNSDTYSDNTLTTGDIIICEMTSNYSCPVGGITDATSNGITINTSFPASVTIAPSTPTSICSGTPVSFTATPVNGGSPSYQWKKNGSDVGTDQDNFTDVPDDGDVYSVQMTSSIACASPTPATSNTVTINYLPTLTPSVSISSDAPSDAACIGSTVSFTAVPTNGGTTPTYQWQKNGSNVGTNSASYSDAGLADGDLIICEMTSNVACPTGGNATATSGTITMTINPIVTPSLSIASDASSNTTCDGTLVTFTATPVDEGTSPVYQWKKNGNDVGTNSAIYSDAALADGDQISCEMTSSAPCPSIATVTSDTITITVNPAPVMTSSTAVSICSGDVTNMGLTATMSSSFTWTLGTNTGSISGASTGSDATIAQTLTNPGATTGSIVYVVTPTSLTNSCVGNPDNITVTVNPKPVLANTAPSMCSGATSTMDLAPSITSTLTWTITSAATITGATTGTNQTDFTQTLGNPSSTAAANIIYSVTPTSTVLGSCVGDATAVTVTVNPKPVLTNTTPAVCNGIMTAIPVAPSVASTLTWTVTNSGAILGGAAGTNQSTFTQTLINPSTTTPDNIIYSATPTATVGACPGDPTTVTVVVTPIPDVAAVTDKTVCSNITLSAINFSSMVSGANFAWSNSNTSIGLGSSGTGNISSFTSTNTGTVPINGTITVTPSLNGCAGPSGTFTITVNPKPTVDAISSQTLCSGVTTNPITITGTVPGTSFGWSNNNTSTGLAANGTGDINSFTSVNTGSTVSTSAITVTPTANGCNGPATTANINVLPLPDTTITKTGSTNICPGDTLTMTLPTAASYLWSNGATTQSIKVTQAGNYSVTVTGANGCVNASSPVTTIVFPQPDTSVTVSGPLSFCAPGSVKLTVNNSAVAVAWSTGATTQSVTIQNSGTFYATVTDNNCSAKTTMFNVNAAVVPVVDAGPDANVEVDHYYTLGHYPLAIGNWPFTYSWTPCNGSFNCAQSNPLITMDTAVITYCVTVTDINGCKSSDCVTLTPIPRPEDVTIAENQSLNLKANPNPFEDVVYIEGANLENGGYKFELINELGAYIKQGYWNVNNKSLHEQLDLSGVAAATYNLIVEHNNLSKAFRLVKHK